MTYWQGTGKYQEKADELAKLIPISGKCAESHLELYRLSVNAYYDIYNNGACNNNRFAALGDKLNDYIGGETEDFKENDWFDLRDFLYEASQENRDFYLFNWDNGKPETKYQAQMLELFERFMNYIVVTTYNRHQYIYDPNSKGWSRQ